MKRRVKRPVLNLEHVIRGALDVLGDLVPVGRAKHQRPQDQHVQRPLHELDSVGRFFVVPHGRYPTLDWGRRSTITLVSTSKQEFSRPSPAADRTAAEGERATEAGK